MAKLVRLAAIILFISGVAPTSHASVLFFDDFNSQNGGVGALNYTGFSRGWTVNKGSVDLIGKGYFDFLPTNGLFIDLDGSTGNAGILSKNLTFDGGVNYILSFDIAGSQRGGSSDSVNISIDGLLPSQTIEMQSFETLTHVVFSFIGDGNSHGLSFEGIGGDNIGVLLDNVKVESPVPVPEPVTMLLIGSGLIGLGIWGRKRVV
jgi:hypothetical protein